MGGIQRSLTNVWPASGTIRSAQQAGDWRILGLISVALLVLYVGLGDGLGFALVSLTGVRSPWVFMLPPLLTALGTYAVAGGWKRLRRTDILVLVAFSAFAVAVLLFEVFAVGDVNVLGLGQLLLFVGLVLVLRAVFVTAPAWLDVAFRRALLLSHYFLTVYVVFAFLSWQLFRFDPSIRAVLTGSSAAAARYYGFRPSGFSAEPQWAAIALAATYCGVHYLLPRHRLNAFIALVIAVEVIQSGTGYLFVAGVAVAVAISWLRSRRRLEAGLVAALALGAAGVLALVLKESVATRQLVFAVAVWAQSAVGHALLGLAVIYHQTRMARQYVRSVARLALTVMLLAVGLVVSALGIPSPAAALASASVAPTVAPSATPAASASAARATASTGSAQPAGGTSPAPSSVLPSPTATLVGIAQPAVERVDNIVSGQDPSTSMRLTSAQVAWNVIVASFPVGVGYGQFRAYAVYPPAFEKMLATLDEMGYYKSDFFVLNYVAELGALGVLLILILIAALVWTGRLLVIGFVGLIVLVSGTVLLPPVLLMAAIVGASSRASVGEHARVPAT